MNEFTTAQAAELLRVTPQTVVRWISDGKIDARKAGLGVTSGYRISEDELRRVATILRVPIDDEIGEMER